MNRVARQGFTEKVTSERRGKARVWSKEKRTEQGQEAGVHLSTQNNSEARVAGAGGLEQEWWKLV